MNLTLAEQETVLSMSADDRGTWHVFSDDVVMQRRLEAIGAQVVKQMRNGNGKEYVLKAEQVSFRKGKRELSPEHKARLAERMRSLKTNTVVTVENEAKP